MATQDEMELAKLVNRLVKASQAKDARIAALEGALRGLRFYVNNPSAWPDAYDDQVSGAIQRAIEIAELEAALRTADDTPTESAPKVSAVTADPWWAEQVRPLMAAPDPAMTLGAAAEPDAPLLGVLLPDGKWAELTNGQLHAGYNRDFAQGVADNHGGTVRAFNEGRGDE